MKTLISIFAISILAFSIILNAIAQVPNKISYQGLLTTSAGTPVTDGSYDLTFKIFDVSTGGTELWTESQSGIAVQRGTFNVLLGSVTTLNISFNKTLYVEVTASGPGMSSPVTFLPRSELTISPYSYTVVGTQCEATGLYSSAGGRNNRARGYYSVVSGGGGATLADSNSALGDYSTVSGGQYNKASDRYATVSGGAHNTASGQTSTVAGGWSNVASGREATVSGGVNNISSQSYSTVSGGEMNTASHTAATVGGGSSNQASGDRATVCGGASNYASGANSTVCGGCFSRARGAYSFVGGGGGTTLADSNSALGDYSCVPGGRANKAAGNYSFAAGRRAKSLHDGSFVWGDATDLDFSSTANNQFLIRANGGLGLNTVSPEGVMDIRPVSTLGLVVQSITNTNSDDIAIKRPGALSATNVRFSLSERSTNNKLWIYGYDGTTFKNFVGFDYPNNKVFYPADDGSTMTIDINNRRVGIGGMPAPTTTLDVAGNVRIQNLPAVGGITIVDVGGGNLGKVVSSKRYKMNIRDLVVDENVLNLKPVRFQYKETGQEDIGLIAEDVETINSDLVIHDNEGKPEAVKYDKIALYLLEIVKLQKERISNLENEISEMKRNSK